MKTLIELFDSRPFENVIGTEFFRPETTVFLCPSRIAGNRRLQEKLRGYLKKRAVGSRLVFLGADLLSVSAVAEVLEKAISAYPDCVVDISGGSDAALFAAGMVCAGNETPVITYSRRNRRFYNLRGRAFPDDADMNISLSVEDCILMAGGSLRAGRVDNGILAAYTDMIDPFFSLYLDYRRQWASTVVWFQRASHRGEDSPASLDVDCALAQKTLRGGSFEPDPGLLHGLQDIGMIKNLDLERRGRVSFTFADSQIRAWLRDVGSVLELYVYKAAIDTGLFGDVVCSAVVDWEGEGKSSDVTNEIDVMAVSGVVPYFISCKTCDVKTEALNELAVLRERFGGKMAGAAIITAENGGAAMRRRAQELDIQVIDLKDLKQGCLKQRLAGLTEE